MKNNVRHKKLSVNLKSIFYSIITLFTLICYFSTPVFAQTMTTVKWLGHAGFQITTPEGNVLFIDPWLKNPGAPENDYIVEKADLILVSHGTPDHFGQSAEIIKNTGARLCSTVETATAYGLVTDAAADIDSQKTLMNVGGTISLFDSEVTITMVQTAHSSGITYNYEHYNKTRLQSNNQISDETKVNNSTVSDFTIVKDQKDEQPAIEEKTSNVLSWGQPAGFVIAIKGGPVIYHTGDTGLFGDMRLIRRLYHPSLLLVPIGGRYTMGPEQAAYAAKMINPTWIIPMHYGTFPTLEGTPGRYNNELLKLNVKSELVVLNPGESKDF